MRWDVLLLYCVSLLWCSLPWTLRVVLVLFWKLEAHIAPLYDSGGYYFFFLLLPLPHGHRCTVRDRGLWPCNMDQPWGGCFFQLIPHGVSVSSNSALIGGQCCLQTGLHLSRFTPRLLVRRTSIAQIPSVIFPGYSSSGSLCL